MSNRPPKPRQYAQQLKTRSLRCSRDNTTGEQIHIVDDEVHDQEPVIDISIYTGAPAQRFQFHPIPTTRAGQQNVPFNVHSPLGVPSKISACARDLVGQCRSCGTVVCRNCTIKTPTNTWLQDRYRREYCAKPVWMLRLKNIYNHFVCHQMEPMGSSVQCKFCQVGAFILLFIYLKSKSTRGNFSRSRMFTDH